MTTFKTKDDGLTLLAYLAYDESDGKVRIPNREIAQEFLNAVDNPGGDGLSSPWNIPAKRNVD